MADVSGDRGQLVLVTALAMATLFVVLALLVNTTIYTGNIAARSDVSESTAVVNYRAEALGAAETTLRHVNRRENDSADGSAAAVDAAYARLNESLRRGVGNWSDVVAAHEAFSGGSTDARVVAATNGTRIAQTNASRTLSGPDGAANWTPVSAATAVRDPTFALDSASLASVSDGDDASELVAAGAFRANLSETDGEVRSLFVWADGGDGIVGATVRGADGTVRSCTAPDDGTVTVDAGAGTFEGDSCPALSAFSGTSDPFAVSFDGGDNAVGTYSFVVDREVDDPAVDQSIPMDSGAPFRTAALYDAGVTVTYRSPDTYYEATAEVPNATA